MKSVIVLSVIFFTCGNVFCLCHTLSTCHTYTALAFSLYTGRDIDSDDSHAHSSCVLHSPLSGSSVNESFAQEAGADARQIGSGALLNPVSCLSFVC